MNSYDASSTPSMLFPILFIAIPAVLIVIILIVARAMRGSKKDDNRDGGSR